MKTTIDLPDKLYEELRKEAKNQDRSIKEILRICVRFGLTAIMIAQDPNSELIFRERININPNNEKPEFEFKDKTIQFVEFFGNQ